MIKLTSPPSGDVIDLAELKDFLRIDGTDNDTLISVLLSAAVDYVEGATGRGLLAQSWKQTFTYFDDIKSLYRSPVASITSVKYYDVSGAQQTLASSVYELVDEEPARIRLKKDQSWPATDGREDGIEIIFVVGYGAAAAIPEVLKFAVRVVVGWMYENRQGGEFPRDTLNAILARHIVTHAL